MAELDLSGLEMDLSGLEMEVGVDSLDVDSTEVEDELAGLEMEEERSAFSKALLPTAGAGIEFENSPVLEYGVKKVVQAGELLDTPRRFGGKLRGLITPNAKHTDLSDPKSSFFEPEAEKAKAIGIKEMKQFQDQIDVIFEKAKSEGRKITFKENWQVQQLMRSKMSIRAGTLGIAMLADEGPTMLLGGVGKKFLNSVKNFMRSSKVSANSWAKEQSKLIGEAWEHFKGAPNANDLQKAKGTAAKIGDEIEDIFVNRPEKFFPEDKVIGQGIKEVGEIRIERVLKKIDQVIARLRLKESNASIVSRLNKLKIDLGQGSVIKATEYTVPGKVISTAKTTPASKRVLGGKPVGETSKQKRIREAWGDEQKMTPETTLNFPEKTIGVDASTTPTTFKIKGKTIYQKATDVKLFNENLSALDDLIDYSATPDKLWNKNLKIIRKAMQRERIRSALKMKDKEKGRAYILALRESHRKSEALNAMKVNHGTNFEQLVSNLFGKNPEKRLKALKNFEEVFGIKIFDRAKLAKFAENISKEAFIPNANKPGEFLLGATSPGKILGLPLITPETAKKVSKLFDGIANKGEGTLTGVQAGLTAMQLNELKNFMGNLIYPDKDESIPLPKDLTQ